MADVKVVAVGRMLIRILSSLRHYVCHLLFFIFCSLGELNHVKDLEKFSSNLRGVLGYIKYSKDKKELSRFLNNSQMILRKNKLVIIIILVEKQL